MKAVTIEQSNELQALARKIRAGDGDAKAFAQLANRKAQEGVGEALQCGLALIAAGRILGRKDLAGWVLKHCEDVTPDAAAAYIRLASNRTSADLKRAYAAIGVPPSNSHHSANLNQGNES
jgi:hypothetical protein